MVQLGRFFPCGFSLLANPEKLIEEMDEKFLENEDSMISVLEEAGKRKKKNWLAMEQCSQAMR